MLTSQLALGLRGTQLKPTMREGGKEKSMGLSKPDNTPILMHTYMQIRITYGACNVLGLFVTVN